jgi:hypothetical protein
VDLDTENHGLSFLSSAAMPCVPLVTCPFALASVTENVRGTVAAGSAGPDRSSTSNRS